MDQLLPAIQGLIQQLQANAQAQAQVPPAAPQAAPAVFALTPAQLNPDDIIDYATTDGKKLYKAATAPLEDKFDITAKEINIFCENVAKRAINAGWTAGTGNIISIPDSTNVNRDLIQEYGRLTMENFHTFVTGFTANGRQRQNDYQLYVFLSDSISLEGQLKLLAEVDNYMVNGSPSGCKYFKLLMQKAIIDTRATSSHLRENLTNLDSYMSTVDSNVPKFNQYVKVNRAGLMARGESTDDLMINLFKGYLNVGDREFVSYIKQKKNEYNEGSDLSVERLMQLAENKYEELVTDNTWKALSPEQEQLVALNAEFARIKDENLRLSKSLKTGGSKQQKPSDKSQKKGKPAAKGNKNRQRQIKDEAWKKQPPKDGDPQTKTVKNKTYEWCPAHMAWTIHKAADCKLKKQRENPSSSTNNSNSERNGGNYRKSAYIQAMNAILEGFKEDDE